MTVYRLVAAPQAGPFATLTAALLYAFVHDIPDTWEAVTEAATA